MEKSITFGWAKEIKDIEVFKVAREALGLSVEP